MWIIPKNLHTSLSAQVMEGLISDSNELSQICEQSLLVRSKRLSLRTWSQKLNRDSWTQHLSGRTLRHSHSKNFTEEWASSLEEYPVSHSVEQVEEEQTKIQDTSSLTLCEVFESLHQNWSSSKMSKECTVQSSKEKGGATQQEPLFCSMSLENWKGEVTRQRQAHSQRLKQERLTYEKDVSSLQLRRGGLETWNYPKALNSQFTHPKEGWSNTGGNHQESHNWATPNAGTKNHEGSLEHYQRRVEIGKQISLHGQVLLNAQNRGKLNPRWVETLMGLPIGWTMPSCTNPLIIEQTNYECLETESCQTPQLQRSEYSGKNWKTPPSSQRGDTIESYLRRSINRFKDGGAPFAILLSIEVDALQKGVELDNLWDKVRDMIDLDTEEIIEKILNN